MDILTKCKECNNYLNFNLIQDNISMHCSCGYNNTFALKEFIHHYDSIVKSTDVIKSNDTFITEIVEQIKKAKEHLNIYFQSIKNVHSNEIEIAYEKSYQRNTNQLTFLQILIDNYDNSPEMKYNILSKEVQIYNCEEATELNKLINYYNEYNIIKEHFIDFKQIQTIRDNTERIYSLIILKDKRIASCSKDGSIRIYNLSNYHCDDIIKRSTYISSICQLDDENIVSCSFDYSVQIGSFVIRNAHDTFVKKVIALPNNRIASGAFDGTIKIWRSDPPYSKTPIIELKGHKKTIYSLLYIKERDMMISASTDSTLKLWNMSTYKCEKSIEGVDCLWMNALYQIDNERVIVGGIGKFYIVNIDKCIIEKKIEDKSLQYVTCFIMLRDKQTVLCGCGKEKGNFCLYDMKTQKYRIVLDCHNEVITALVSIDDYTFISSSFDSSIKVWKY